MTKRFNIRHYTTADKAQWDQCVDRSKNGTFLFKRDYMDYHSDRFTDRSLVACDRLGRIVAILPANIHENTLHSHQGLTYGGWVIPGSGFDIISMMTLWDDSLDIMRRDGIKQLIYKPVPHIYHLYPAEEDLYALFRSGATLMSRRLSSTIYIPAPMAFDKTSRRKGRSTHSVTISCSDRIHHFWDILETLLHDRYSATPVHSLEEIISLKTRFPDNIILVTALEHDEIVAGALFYRTSTVMHLQYAASTERGREINAFPKLYQYVLNHLCSGCMYLDLGTSNEQNGMYLNQGLVRHKCSLGARATVYDTYTIML